MTYAYDSGPRTPTRLAFHVSRIVIDAVVLLVLEVVLQPEAEGEYHR